jgi:hypothetical protein
MSQPSTFPTDDTGNVTSFLQATSTCTTCTRTSFLQEKDRILRCNHKMHKVHKISEEKTKDSSITIHFKSKHEAEQNYNNVLAFATELSLRISHQCCGKKGYVYK